MATSSQPMASSVRLRGTSPKRRRAGWPASARPPSMNTQIVAFFFTPGSFTVLADARDVDGTVTNVAFFAGTVTTNSLGQTTNAPYFIPQTNLPPGIYAYIARATDNMGAM